MRRLPPIQGSATTVSAPIRARGPLRCGRLALAIPGVLILLCLSNIGTFRCYTHFPVTPRVRGHKDHQVCPLCLILTTLTRGPTKSSSSAPLTLHYLRKYGQLRLSLLLRVDSLTKEMPALGDNGYLPATLARSSVRLIESLSDSRGQATPPNSTWLSVDRVSHLISSYGLIPSRVRSGRARHCFCYGSRA